MLICSHFILLFQRFTASLGTWTRAAPAALLVCWVVWPARAISARTADTSVVFVARSAATEASVASRWERRRRRALCQQQSLRLCRGAVVCDVRRLAQFWWSGFDLLICPGPGSGPERTRARALLCRTRAHRVFHRSLQAALWDAPLRRGQRGPGGGRDAPGPRRPRADQRAVRAHLPHARRLPRRARSRERAASDGGGTRRHIAIASIASTAPSFAQRLAYRNGGWSASVLRCRLLCTITIHLLISFHYESHYFNCRMELHSMQCTLRANETTTKNSMRSVHRRFYSGVQSTSKSE